MGSKLRTHAYHHIRESMLSGQWSDGRFILPATLAEQIGISYTPVREAVIQLVSEGFLDYAPKRGVRLRMLDRPELEDLFGLRMILESGAAKLAAKMITAEQIESLRENCRTHLLEIREACRLGTQPNERGVVSDEAITRVAQTNAAFHLGIFRASHNAKLIKLAGDLRILTRALRCRVHPPGNSVIHQLAHDHSYHCRIFRALAKHDAQAAGEWMEKHIAEAKAYHLAAYDWKLREGHLSDITAGRWSNGTLSVLKQMEDHLGRDEPE